MQGPLRGGGGRRLGTLILQLLASALAVLLLLWRVDLEEMLRALGACRLEWLVPALGLRALALLVHDLRLWQAIRAFNPVSLSRVVAIGFACGLLNVLLPVRIGDVAVAALLMRECGVAASAAVLSIGLVAFLEVLFFGGFALVVLLGASSSWAGILGAERVDRAVMLLSVGILAAVLAFGLAAAVGRRLSGRGAAGASGDRTGPLELLRQVFSRLGDAVGRFRFVAVQGGLTTLQILLFAGTPVLLLRALEIPTPSAWLAGTGVMAISSLAGILLPPSYGAGPAAASVFVLGAMGVSAESSMAFATLLWVNASVLPVALGLVPAWRRIGVLRAVAEGRAEEGVTPRR